MYIGPIHGTFVSETVKTLLPTDMAPATAPLLCTVDTVSDADSDFLLKLTIQRAASARYGGVELAIRLGCPSVAWRKPQPAWVAQLQTCTLWTTTVLASPGPGGRKTATYDTTVR
jgi:hypothetical protein